MAGLECHNETLNLIVNTTTTTATNISVTDLEAVAEYSSWVCNPFYGQIAYVISYGITSAAYVLLTTLVLADLFGPENFSNSFGLLLLFQGVATFAGPPIVGFMFDAYGSYNEGLILMGVFIAVSGIMLYPIPCIRETLEKKQGKRLSCQDVRNANEKQDGPQKTDSEGEDLEERLPIV